MKNLIHNVIWPAVAGNILWAFLSVAVDPGFTGMSMWTRLIALFAIGFYLSSDWIKRTPDNIRDDWKYWVVDLALAAALATFAIMTQLKDTPWCECALAVAFAVAILGHFSGSWDKSQSSKLCAHPKFAAFNVIGLAILGLGLFVPLPHDVFPPAAISLVVVLFIFLG